MITEAWGNAQVLAGGQVETERAERALELITKLDHIDVPEFDFELGAEKGGEALCEGDFDDSELEGKYFFVSQ